MWIFCCGMYRSASTLQFQITSRLVADFNLGQQVGWIDAKQFFRTRNAYTDNSGMKVVKVHICTDAIAEEFHCNNAMGIYSFRDIRDVFASYLQQRQVRFDVLWNEKFVEECLDNFARWVKLPRVIASSYQSITANVPAEVKKIANHLGLSLSDEECQTIANDYSPQMQEERMRQFREKLLSTPLNPNDHRKIVDYHDEQTLLHINHLNSGKTGRWRDDLLPVEVTAIEEKVRVWCDRNGYDISLFLTPALPSQEVHQHQTTLSNHTNYVGYRGG